MVDLYTLISSNISILSSILFKRFGNSSLRDSPDKYNNDMAVLVMPVFNGKAEVDKFKSSIITFDNSIAFLLFVPIHLHGGKKLSSIFLHDFNIFLLTTVEKRKMGFSRLLDEK